MAETATLAPWLARYTALSGWREWMARVHSIDGWSVATDGRAVLAVKDGGQMETGIMGKYSQAPHDLAHYLATQTVEPVPASLRSLLLWCEQIESDKCESCQGHGTFSGQWEDGMNGCPDCEGRGCDYPAVYSHRAGSVAGVVISRNRLAWMLAPELLDLSEDSITIGACRVKHQGKWESMNCVCIKGECWRLLVMGLTKDKSGEAEDWGVIPTFHPEPVFAEMWIERESTDTRLILADWLEEQGDPYAAVLREPQ